MKTNEFGPGWLMVAKDAAFDSGLWFVFHHETAGTVAFDIAREHPWIGYRGFETALDFEDPKDESEKIVLLGGPERSDDALIILHETGASGQSNRINDDFSFQAYSYVLLPGKPPMITRADNAPTRIRLKPRANFLVIMGYRTWEGGQLSAEIAAGKWICLPAALEVVFETSHKNRRERTLNIIN